MSYSICSFRTINNSKVILRKFLGLVDVVGAQTLYIYKLMEFVMVSKNKELIFAAFYIVAPFLKSFNNS